MLAGTARIKPASFPNILPIAIRSTTAPTLIQIVTLDRGHIDNISGSNIKLKIRVSIQGRFHKELIL
jgi:hypothetical protein